MTTKDMTSTPPRVGYRVRETVAMTGLTERTIRRWISDGTLDSFRVGSTVWVRTESFDALFGGDR